jgi:hypothetical protein
VVWEKKKIVIAEYIGFAFRALLFLSLEVERLNSLCAFLFDLFSFGLFTRLRCDSLLLLLL